VPSNALSAERQWPYDSSKPQIVESIFITNTRGDQMAGMFQQHGFILSFFLLAQLVVVCFGYIPLPFLHPRPGWLDAKSRSFKKSTSRIVVVVVQKTTTMATTTRLFLSRQPPPPPYGQMEKDGEESLMGLFQRAIVLQRSGAPREALEEYQRFIKAAEQCDVNPQKYAEVYCNMGACEIKLRNREMAQHYFELALRRRTIGTAHVNLALLALQQGTKVQQVQQSQPRQPQSSARDENNSQQQQQQQQQQQEQQEEAAWKALAIAKQHCEDAIALNDDRQSMDMATKLLQDIELSLSRRPPPPPPPQ
jgi:tetratricopeptide (TPR) repeat protein